MVTCVGKDVLETVALRCFGWLVVLRLLVFWRLLILICGLGLNRRVE